MSLRRLFVLVSQLPPDSRTKAALAGDRQGRRWDELTALTADIHELLQVIRIEQLASIPTKEKITPPTLQHVPRPDVDEPEDVNEADVDEAEDGPDERPRETQAERYERIQRFLSQFDPPAPPAPEPTARR
jgi:hypothetical protein